MAEAASTAPSPAAANTSEADKRSREQVDKRLAQSAAVSHGRITLGGKSMDYLVSAAYVPVVASGFRGATVEPEAAIFTTAYMCKAVAGSPRPVCFAFNGGPGSASIWLQFGALGPKHVPMPEDGSQPYAPFRVVDNPVSWFEHFDMVFIDPPHTGWSITSSEAARKKMLSVDGDVDALAESMRVWLTRHKRWGSPVYLAGESYGTTRGAALADKLQALGVSLSGVILISCAMDLQSLVFAPRNDLPYALFLPGFANTAQYHGLLKGEVGASPEAAREAAEAFVVDDYVAALHAGSRLDAKRQARIAQRIAELTGLPRALVEQRNLRIDDTTFFFEALRPQGRIVGRLESRVTGPMAAQRTREWEFDPGIEAIAAPYTMAALAYYGETLGLQSETRYEVLSDDVHREWHWNRGEDKGNAFACTSPDLSRAMRRNPHLKVFVASGRYDLGTPYSASDWSVAQLDIDAQVRQRLQHHYYDAGHMMYTREADLLKLKNDVAAWLAE
jgi:carboxypeptidase C (cathepsin A)